MDGQLTVKPSADILDTVTFNVQDCEIITLDQESSQGLPSYEFKREFTMSIYEPMEIQLDLIRLGLLSDGTPLYTAAVITRQYPKFDSLVIKNLNGTPGITQEFTE